MANSITITDTEFAGAMKVRVVEVDITNYDDDANSDGESFTPADAGMRRFQQVVPEAMNGEGGATTVVNAVAQYDYANEALRLLVQSNDGTGTANDELVELGSNNNEGVKLKVLCFGR